MVYWKRVRMKKTFPLGKMSFKEMDALDANKKRYITVFEFCRFHKNSFVLIEIKKYRNEYFYGLNTVFSIPPSYNSHSFAALRKWGTYTSIEECKKSAIKEVEKSPVTEREKKLIPKFRLQDILVEE